MNSSSETEKAKPADDKKTVTIVVNGREHTIEKGKATYEQIVGLAYPNPDFDGNLYKVTYFREKNNDEHEEEGSLAKGGTIQLKDGLVFTVGRTIRS